MRTIEIFKGEILNPRKKPGHNLCYLIFGEDEVRSSGAEFFHREKIFLKQVKSVNKIIKNIEREKSKWDLDIKFPKEEGLFFERNTKTKYKYFPVENYNIREIENYLKK